MIFAVRFFFIYCIAYQIATEILCKICIQGGFILNNFIPNFIAIHPGVLCENVLNLKCIGITLKKRGKLVLNTKSFFMFSVFICGDLGYIPLIPTEK